MLPLLSALGADVWSLRVCFFSPPPPSRHSAAAVNGLCGLCSRPDQACRCETKNSGQHVSELSGRRVKTAWCVGGSAAVVVSWSASSRVSAGGDDGQIRSDVAHGEASSGCQVGRRVPGGSGRHPPGRWARVPDLWEQWRRRTKHIPNRCVYFCRVVCPMTGAVKSMFVCVLSNS